MEPVAPPAPRRCPKCNAVWPAAVPRCFSCGHGDGRAPRVRRGELVLFLAACVIGLAFVLAHSARRREEHPALPSAPPPGLAPVQAAAPDAPTATHRALPRRCTLTPLELRALVPADARQRALACAAGLDRAGALGPTTGTPIDRVQASFDAGGSIVDAEPIGHSEARACVVTALAGLRTQAAAGDGPMSCLLHLVP